MSTELSSPSPVLVARSEDVVEGGRYVVALNETLHIGIFRFRDRLYAYENTCPHQGGPVCQGRLVSGVQENLDDQGRSRGLTFDSDDPHIVCPWHGVEYRVTTGKHPGSASLRLTPVEVHERDGEIHVVV